VIFALALGLGLPLAVLLVIVIVVCLVLCCCLCRRGADVKPVEAINNFISWPTKTIGSRPGTVRSSTTELYSSKDDDSGCGTPTSQRTVESNPSV